MFLLWIVISGIIPAGAGLTERRHKEICDGRDHPRGCGAHKTISYPIASNMGSSPRVRGSQPIPVTNSCGKGIIPAGAGLTL